MNRTKKMQILAIIALASIGFSIVSTALLIIFPGTPQEAQEQFDLSSIIGSGTTVKTNSGETIVLSGATVKATATGGNSK